mmetsp:Transcript_10909/g.9629  ORF Transcript_10909/g.9629 Transcript_10909/m.9629 type:complete len:263 (-) Transcript_10909:68-856(-)
MNKTNYNFSTKENIFEFGMGRDYLNEMEQTSKPTEMFFNFPEQIILADPCNFNELDGAKNFNDYSEDLFAFESQRGDFESLNCFNINNSPYEEASNMDNSDKTKAKSKSKSDTHSLSFSNDYDCCKKIDTLSGKDDCEADLDPEFARDCISGDLNIFVEKLLNSTAVDYLKDQGIEVDDKTAQMLSIKKRKRKTKSQVVLLEAEYKNNQDWTKSFMQVLGEKLGMSASSIYKWHWDQKHKDEKPMVSKDKKIRLSSFPSKRI